MIDQPTSSVTSDKVFVTFKDNFNSSTNVVPSLTEDKPNEDLKREEKLEDRKKECSLSNSSQVLRTDNPLCTKLALVGTRSGRPWSKQPTIFSGGPKITIGMVLKALRWLPVDLFNVAECLIASYDSPVFDEAWNLYNSLFKLPRGFLERHNSLDLIEHSDERLLPNWPVCPGPLARESCSLLIRPDANINLYSFDKNMASIYQQVIKFGVPNYRGAKIPINVNFKDKVWEHYLRGYNDTLVIQFMKYGWPAGYESEQIPCVGLPNHPSSHNFPDEIMGYINKELKHGAICGPFQSSPFTWFRNNPLMVRPKKEVGKYRVILDLYFPCGMSVNSFIPRLSFDGAPYKLRLPTALDLAELIADYGPNCFLYKLDLSRAYRQLPGDPMDWALLGFEWDGEYYIDTKVPFGLRHGAQYCERVTTAVCHAAKVKVGADVAAYIDDMGGVAPDNEDFAERQFRGVCDTVTDLGLELALDKCIGPARVMSWTGTTFDTVAMTMKIDECKIDETLEIAQNFMSREDISIKDLEMLLGKLQHCLKFCPGGRRFLNRLLKMRRGMIEGMLYSLSDDAKLDVSWFLSSLKEFNGVAMIRSQFKPSVVIFVDACLIGGGSLWEGESFVSYKWPYDVLKWQLSINDLEMFNVLVSLRLWKTKLRGMTVQIWCDNNTSVKSLFSGRARNKFMSSCLRELWFLACTGDIFLGCSHIAGKKNNQADLLSRAFNSPKDWGLFSDWSQKAQESQTQVPSSCFSYPDTV